MSENRKYYYMKLKENFFTDAKMVILESMQDGLLYSNLLLKMYLMSLKYNGILMLNDHLPHTPQTIATFTRHQIGTVERAINVFLEFGFVEILTDGSYYMADIQLLIGQSSTEGERKRKERMRLKRQNLLPSGQVDKCPPEIRDKRLDIRDKENRECVGTPAYGRYQNVFLTDAFFFIFIAKLIFAKALMIMCLYPLKIIHIRVYLNQPIFHLLFLFLQHLIVSPSYLPSRVMLFL